MTTLEKRAIGSQVIPNRGAPQQQEGGTMMDELLASPNTPKAAPPSFVDQLKPFNTGPVEDFLITMMSVADNKGVLDSSFGPQTVEDAADLVDEQSDPMQFLSREELMLLVNKFMMIPEPNRTKLANELRTKLPPNVASRLEAIVRFAQGRDVQQQVAPRR